MCTGYRPQLSFSPVPPLQVIFGSRTHSQLSQFIGELRRTDLTAKISVVALAARKVGGE